MDRCDCCDGSDLVRWPALVAPFIADYVLGQTSEPCALAECRACGFRFFDLRFTDDEIARLYRHYRGEEYYAARHRHEPWYTRRFNDRFVDDAATIEARQAHLLTTLSSIADRTLARVIDYGGDCGQLIPPSLGATLRDVYDLSDAPPVAGVRKVDDSALARSGYDLAILTGVLEHASEPSRLVERVASLLDRHGLLYIEVPWERFSLRFVPRGSAYAAYLRVLSRRKYLLRALDFYSTAFRVKIDAVPPLGFAKVHEHLSFFDTSSLTRLLQRCGLNVRHAERGVVAGVELATAVASV